MSDLMNGVVMGVYKLSGIQNNDVLKLCNVLIGLIIVGIGLRSVIILIKASYGECENPMKEIKNLFLFGAIAVSSWSIALLVMNYVILK